MFFGLDSNVKGEGIRVNRGAAMRPAELLDTSRILIGIDSSRSKQEVIRALIGTAVADGAAEGIVAELLAREDKMTTGIGNGVAIPHARSASVEKPVAALGVSPAGIDFGALDEAPVNIVFTFITPEDSPLLHIETLAHAVAILGSARVRSAIISALDPASVMAILTQVPTGLSL